MDQKEIDEAHYIPSNHAFVSVMMGGVDQVRTDAAEKIAEVHDSADAPDDLREWMVWYGETINGIADKMEKKDDSWKVYPPFLHKDNVLNIVRDFSEYPGGRYKLHGKYSGEELRELIICRLKENPKETLIIEMDGTYGYPPSFLEETFGGLIRALPEVPAADIINSLSLKSSRLRYKENILEYMHNAADNRNSEE